MGIWGRRGALIGFAVVLIGGAGVWLVTDDSTPDASEGKRSVKPATEGSTSTSTSTTTTTLAFALPPATEPITSGGGAQSPAPPAGPPAAPHVSPQVTSISITTEGAPYTVLVFVKNDGTVPASVVASGSGNFLSVVSRCSAPLAVGAQCQVDVVFDAQSAPIGVHTGSVQIGAVGGNTTSISFTANDTK